MKKPLMSGQKKGKLARQATAPLKSDALVQNAMLADLKR
jgi:hypothetical protein